MRYIIAFILSWFGLSLAAQQSMDMVLAEEARLTPSVKTIFYRLGDKNIPLKVQQFGERTDLVFINLHDDETTAVEATRKVLEQDGGLLIEVENNLKRRISFRLGPVMYSVDPNRIFSKEGIKKSLEEKGRSNRIAVEEIEKLAERILQLIPDNATCVIALHNNTPDYFGALSYSAGNKKAKEALRVYINPHRDDDNFFLTTDTDLYEQLANKKYNTILQDNIRCTEDGSLSVYCGKKNIRYVNLETEHGKQDDYFEMMRSLLSVLPQPVR